MKRAYPEKVLYLSYDGLSDHIGQSQILPYLLACKARGVDIGILTFEKSSKKEKIQKIQELLNNHDLTWHRLAFSEGGNLSKLKDFFRFVSTAFKVCRMEKYTVVHSRSYIASCVGLMLKKKLRKKLIFDKRDFWIDAKTETGRIILSKFSHRVIHSFLRGFEKRLFLQADHIISLTEKAKQVVLHKYPSRKPEDITVIPCCVDLSLFDPQKISVDETRNLRQSLGLNSSYVLGYVGSVDPAYMIPDLLDCFKTILSGLGDVKLLFLVNNDKGEVLRIADERGVARENIVVTSATRETMPLYISALDCGIYFITPSYAKQATSPTKLSEMLALRKPVITNKGVGDVEKIFDELECGYLISTFSEREYQQAAMWLRQNKSCNKNFDLSQYSLQFGADQYYAVYEKLFG